jgi:diketogulonate reductase-like aldo/keto reductase
MERPALQRLMADIAKGLIDAVVVYKVGGVGPLRRGIELGAFLIDTAEIYGTEEAVAEAIRGIRDRVFIATKVWAEHLRYDDVLPAAEASVRRLNAGYIDLYQIHWWNPNVPIQETMRAMEALVDRA